MNSIALILFALGWSTLPLVPALRELYQPTDAKALDVFQGNAADAKEPVRAAQALYKANPQTDTATVLARTGTLVATADDTWQGAAEGAQSVLLRGCALLQSVPAHLKALHADSIVVAAGAEIEVPLSAESTITLADKAEVRTAQAAELVVCSPADHTMEPARTLSAPSAEQAAGTVNGAQWQELQGWWHAPRDAAVSAGQVIRGDILVAGDLTLGPGVVVTGSIKAAGRVLAKNGVVILGNCVATSIDLQERSAIRGCAVADEFIALAYGCQVGDSTHEASVIAKDITLGKHVRIFGGLTAHRSANSVVRKEARPA